tara:strand:+ start:1290 stop:1718 length:429 start_codon:yes stop_codon:yes gene_type:complete
MKIYIGCDHAGYEIKQKIISKFKDNFDFEDCGCHSNNSVDYADYAKNVTDKIKNKTDSYGILICGSGIGISIAANRIKNIRAALCTSIEHAKMSRLHNDANVLALGSRLSKETTIFKIVKIFFATPFEGGRHKLRIKKIDKL